MLGMEVWDESCSKVYAIVCGTAEVGNRGRGREKDKDNEDTHGVGGGGVATLLSFSENPTHAHPFLLLTPNFITLKTDRAAHWIVTLHRCQRKTTGNRG